MVDLTEDGSKGGQRPSRSGWPPAGFSPSVEFVGPPPGPEYSDHRLQLFKLAEGFSVLNWNVAGQYRSRASGGTNNGFDASESAAQYGARLRRVAREIGHAARAQTVTAITLQECPASGGVLNRALRRALPGWSIRAAGRLLTLTPTPAQVAEVGAPAVIGELSGWFVSPGRVLINCHLRWDGERVEDMDAARRALASALDRARRLWPGQSVALVGDLNRDHELDPLREGPGSTVQALFAGEAGHLVIPPGPSNLRWSNTLAATVAAYADYAYVLAAPDVR